VVAEASSLITPQGTYNATVLQEPHCQGRVTPSSLPQLVDSDLLLQFLLIAAACYQELAQNLVGHSEAIMRSKPSCSVGTSKVSSNPTYQVYRSDDSLAVN